MSLALYVFVAPILLGATLALFFFVTTRGSLLAMNWSNTKNDHIYWLYKNPILVWLTDWQLLVSMVLLFHYDTLSNAVRSHIATASFKNKHIVQIGAVSGNITERLGVMLPTRVRLSILDREIAGIRNTMQKLIRKRLFSTSYCLCDAENMPIASGASDCSLSFFLFHELPYSMKQKVFEESLRIVRPGGKFVYAEFHRPETALLRLLQTVIFGLFEPHAKAMWYWDPLASIDDKKYSFERALHFYGYFQVVSIKKL